MLHLTISLPFQNLRKFSRQSIPSFKKMGSISSLFHVELKYQDSSSYDFISMYSIVSNLALAYFDTIDDAVMNNRSGYCFYLLPGERVISFIFLNRDYVENASKIFWRTCMPGRMFQVLFKFQSCSIQLSDELTWHHQIYSFDFLKMVIVPKLYMNIQS